MAAPVWVFILPTLSVKILFTRALSGEYKFEFPLSLSFSFFVFSTLVGSNLLIGILQGFFEFS